MQLDEAKETHARLCALIEAEGIVLRFNVRLGDEDPFEAGYYLPAILSTSKEPKIQIYRPIRSDRAENYEQELATLAHEYGHAISDRRGQRPQVDMPTPSPGLPENAKRAIMEEESRAWRHGRETLVSLGVTDFGGFQEQQAQADAEYARRLGL